MIEPIETYIHKLESMLSDAEWLGCDSPSIQAALELAYAEQERGEAYHVCF